MPPLTGENDGTAGFGVEGKGGGGDGVKGLNGTGSNITVGFPAGVRGDSDNGFGVIALSHTWTALHAEANGNAAAAIITNAGAGGAIRASATGTGIALDLSGEDSNAVRAENKSAKPTFLGGNNGDGICGRFLSAKGTGVLGQNGESAAEDHNFVASGVWGNSDNGQGVLGTSLTGDAVHGEAYGNGSAIYGKAHAAGLAGRFEGNVEITGTLTANPAKGDGITGWSHDPQHSGVVALHDHGGHGLYAKSNGFAGQFDGDVNVNGVLHVSQDIMLTGADCAEDFDLAPGTAAEPGCLLVIGDDGRLTLATEAYDTRVAGVVSGAGDFRPALRLDHRGLERDRGAIALVGKAFCKADASAGAIRVGDLLTTSSLPGHAMRVSDPGRAVGAIVGKALAGLADGVGLIPILIALQ